MRVLVLHSDVAGDATPDEIDTLLTSRAIAAALNDLGHDAELQPVPADLNGLAHALCRTDFGIVFNMVERFCGQDCLAAAIPAVLDTLGIAYTGSGAATIALAADKPATKRILRAAGLPTPDWVEPPAWGDLGDGISCIVKSATEDASLGLEDASVVRGKAAMEARIQACRRLHGGRWFAEAFVEGREFNVAVLEDDGMPLVLPIQEMRFCNWPGDKPQILSYRAKWDEESGECAGTLRHFGVEREEPALAARLSKLARDSWRLLGIRGYVRVDVRVDELGSPHILELNPNPCLDPESGFAIAAGQAGLSYAQLITRLLESGLQR